MHILVIGGSGFIGARFVKFAAAAGHRITIVSRKLPVGENTESTWISGGIEAIVANPRLLSGADIVCHFASTSVPASSNTNPATDVSENLTLGLRLLEAMRREGSKRIMYLSSGGAVYGQARYSPIDEDHPLAPISSYGIVKMAMERYLSIYENAHDFSPLVIRPANPYGPGQRSSEQFGLIPAMLEIARTNGTAHIFGDGSVIRDFIYIDDLCSLLLAAAESNCSGIYNAGSGQGASIIDIIAAAEQVSGRMIKREYLPARPFDPPEITLDISKASADFGWSPQVSLNQGLAATWHGMVNVGTAHVGGRG